MRFNCVSYKNRLPVFNWQSVDFKDGNSQLTLKYKYSADFKNINNQLILKIKTISRLWKCKQLARSADCENVKYYGHTKRIKIIRWIKIKNKCI